METVVVILVVVLIVVVVVNIFITSSRNRQTDGTSLRDVAGQIQAAGDAQAQSISLIQQQLDTLRQQTSETLKGNAESINKRLDATNTQFLESTARLTTGATSSFSFGGGILISVTTFFKATS